MLSFERIGCLLKTQSGTVAHIHSTLHVRVASQANQTKLHFPFQTHEAARFPGQISCTLSFFISCQETWVSMYVCEGLFKWPQCLLPLVIKTHRLVHGHFCKGASFAFFHETPTYCSWKQWKIVLSIIFSPFVIFFQQQNCYMKCAWKTTQSIGREREKHCYYTINCIIFFGAPRVCSRGAQIWDSTISITNCNFMFK